MKKICQILMQKKYFNPQLPAIQRDKKMKRLSIFQRENMRFPEMEKILQILKKKIF